MASIFSQIILGHIPAHVVAETKEFIAFLDRRPLQMGHTLAVPKKEVDYIFDLEDEAYIGLHLFAKSVATAIQKAVPGKRIATAVIGLEVPHTHIHLVPISQISDMDWSRKLEPSDDELANVALRIRACL